MSIFVVKKNIQIMGSHALAQTVPAGTTLFLSMFASGFLTALSANPLRYDGTLMNLIFRTGSAQPATGSLVCTISFGGIATALSVTVPAGGVGSTYQNLSTIVPYTAGTNIRFDVTNNAAAASALVGMVSFDFLFS